MTFFSLIDVIRQYCTDNSISFIYGNDAYANALSGNSIIANQLILVADFSCKPTLAGGRVVTVTYSGVIMLGSKCETTTIYDVEISTESSLAETPIEKYDNRLKSLSTSLMTILGDLTCNNELEITNINIKFDLNKFDLNADFVAATITITH
jgi:hypothetical protein